jgi:hypothetical protein
MLRRSDLSKEILLMWCTTIWRTTRITSKPDKSKRSDLIRKLQRLAVCLAKTSYTRRMNDLRKTGFRFFRYNSCHDCVASTFPRLVGQRFPFPGGPRPREPGSPSAIAGSARATTSPSGECSTEHKFLLAASSTTVFTTPFHRSHFLGPRCDRSCSTAQPWHTPKPPLPTIEFA